MAPKSKDVQATKAAKFLSRDSRINLDGEDMALLRAGCFERDDFTCTDPDCTTPREWIQMHHIIPKGSNGVDRDDRLENMATLCINCHSKRHVRVRLGEKVSA